MSRTGRVILTFGATLLFIMPAAAAPPSESPATPKVESVSFEDAFHLTPEQAEKALGAAKLKVWRAALEDFNAALAYKPPAHATWKETLKDGGTTKYAADGYELIVVKGLSGFGQGKEAVDGFMYGPVLFLKETGGGPQISRVSFYPKDVLEKLLK
jgi:hypothetical protein